MPEREVTDFSTVYSAIQASSMSEEVKSSLMLRVHNLEQVVRDFEEAKNERISRLESSLAKMRASVSEVESEVASRYEKVLREYVEREERLQRQYDQVMKRYEKLEQSTFERQKALEEEFSGRNENVRALEAKYRAELADLVEERDLLRDESQKKIQENSQGFVKETVSKLESRGEGLSRISFWWSICGGAALVLGAAGLAFLTFKSFNMIVDDVSWGQLVFYVMKGSIFLGASLVISRYSFIFSSNYMKESLRTFDRLHAIKFGQFFVNTYGASATWDEVRMAFSNWNGNDGADWESSLDGLSSDLAELKEVVKDSNRE